MSISRRLPGLRLFAFAPRCRFRLAIVHRYDQPPPRVAGPRDLLRRVTRWLNLTLVHQAIWPAIVLVTGSVMHRPGSSSIGDVIGMIAGPIVAGLIAYWQIRNRLGEFPSPPIRTMIADQTRLIVLGLPVMVLIGRAITQDPDVVLKIALVGAANVAAYHLIHFGVVRSFFPNRYVITGLFGLSWAIHQIADALARDTGGSFIFHAFGGFSVGVLVAVVAQLVHRWPGGRLTAPAAHWLVIYLIFGFSR
jgi:hypothetical protein